MGNNDFMKGAIIATAIANDDSEDKIRALKKKGGNAHMILIKNLFHKKRIGGFLCFGGKKQFMPNKNQREMTIKIRNIDNVTTVMDDNNKLMTAVKLDEDYYYTLYTDESIESLTRRINDILNGKENK